MLQVKMFLEAAKFYIMGGLLATVLALGVVVHIKNNKIDDLKIRQGALTTKLEVSNSSVSSLTTQLNRVTETLVEKDRLEKETQKRIASELKQQEIKDKKLVDIEAYLKSRKTTLNCSIPKDLTDAWNNL